MEENRGEGGCGDQEEVVGGKRGGKREGEGDVDESGVETRGEARGGCVRGVGDGGGVEEREECDVE